MGKRSLEILLPLLRRPGLWAACCLTLLCSVSALAGSATQTGQIAAWIQDADTYAEQGKLTAAFDVYLRLAGLDPCNPHVRAQIFTILREYKTRASAAPEQENDARSHELQRYRLGIRDLLYVLTTQLKQYLERYGEQVAALKAGQDVVHEIPPLLTDIIIILGDVTTVYEEFPQSGDDAATTQKILDRLKQTIAQYEQEFEFYSQALNKEAR